MMHNPLALDYASDLVRERIQQAARDALADQLARQSPRPTLGLPVRPFLAAALRSVAARLDPSLACEVCVAVPVSSR